MGLLEQMRSSSDSTGMQVILIAVILLFIGAYAVPQGDRSAIVAQVNGVRIMDTEYSRAFRNAARQREAQLQKTLNDAEREQLQDEVKQQLIDRELLVQEAADLGIYVSDYEVGRTIAATFREDGKYSKKLYERYLKMNQTSSSAFEEELREDLTIGKVQQLATLGVTLSDRALKDEYVKSNTKVDLELIEIRPARMQRDIEVSDADAQAWLEDSDNASLVKQAYDDDFERLYSRPERVRYRMIRLAVEEDGPKKSDLVSILNGVRKEAERGADFAELAKKWSEDPSATEGGDKGVQAIKLLTPQDAVNLDGLEIGQLTKVFPTENDVRLLKLEERLAAEEDPLEEVQDEIAKRLVQKERADDRANEARRGIVEKWSEAGEIPQDLLDEYGLTARTTGPMPTFRSSPFAPPQAILDWSRTAEVGAVRSDAYEENGTWTLAQLESREEPDMEEFESNKERERESLLFQRRQAFFGDWMKGLREGASIN
ncbi:MAG: SurA N-terminal domain-containing protein [Myxococcota bacterium]